MFSRFSFRFYDFRVETMFGSSLPLFVLSGVRVLLMLFVCIYGYAQHYFHIRWCSCRLTVTQWVELLVQELLTLTEFIPGFKAGWCFLCTVFFLSSCMVLEQKILQINIREYRRGNKKWTIHRNWKHRVHKTKKNKTKTSHNAQTNTNNVNTTWALLQTRRPSQWFLFAQCMLDLMLYNAEILLTYRDKSKNQSMIMQ